MRTLRSLLPVVFICMTLLFVRAGVWAQDWVARYNGPGNGSDAATAIVLDDTGSIYVTGASAGSGTGSDYATIKYTPEGDTVWVRRYNGPGNASDAASALVADASGHVYVTGESAGAGTGGDYATVKYAPSGDTLWTRRYNGSGNRRDMAGAVALDSAGNVYVSGSSQGSGTSYDYATLKYSATGDLVWERRYNGPTGGSDFVTGLGIDAGGNVYVTGTSWDATDPQFAADFTTIKYSPAGDTLWIRIYSSPPDPLDPAASRDVASDIDVDADGNAYVTGLCGGVEVGTTTVIKYSASGSTLWVGRSRGPEGSGVSPADAVEFGGGYVATAGFGLGDGFGADFFDYSTILFAPGGDTLWARTYDGPGHDWDMASAVAVDRFNDVSVTGYSVGAGTNNDYATLKYAVTGGTRWVRRYDGPAGGDDLGVAIAVDAKGSVYVTGRSTGIATGWDYATIKYSTPVGDVTCDAVLDLADVVLLGNHLDGLVDLAGTCGGSQADVDLDGDIDGDDYVQLYDLISGAGP